MRFALGQIAPDEVASTSTETGAGVGAAVGGGAGLLAGLGLLAIPGLGPVVAAGWLAATAVGMISGAITAALFLSEFVGDIPWVHLDIAGPGFTERATPLAARGGTGVPVRTLVKFLVDRAAAGVR